MKKFAIIIMITLFLGGLCACSKQESALKLTGIAKQIQLNDTITLMLGDSAVLKSENLLLTFLGVPEDSRCPIDAVCIWGGDAKVMFRVETLEKIIALDLHTASDYKNSKIVGNYLINLISVKPHRKKEENVKKEDYQVRILISKSPKNLVSGVIKDYTGLDGCGLVIELDNGKKLEPRKGVSASLKNKRVALSYVDAKAVSICMVGTVVDVTEIYELYE